MLKSELSKGGYIFDLNGFDFKFYFGIHNDEIILRRSQTISKCSISHIPNHIKVFVAISWSFANLVIDCIYGDSDKDRSRSEVPTTPVAPPKLLLRWFRLNNLIPVEEYQSEEEFREKIVSHLLSIQDKIEDAGSYDQFWNLEYEGNRIVNRIPKNEIEVQPIINCLLSDQLLLSSIEIIPEFKTRIGNLDFLFIAKIKDSGFSYFCVEFKNAHSSKLYEGLTTQLPLYIESKNATYGAYCFLNYFGDMLEKPNNLPDNIYFDLELKRLTSNNPVLIDKVRIIEYKLSKPKSASKK